MFESVLKTVGTVGAFHFSFSIYYPIQLGPDISLMWVLGSARQQRVISTQVLSALSVSPPVRANTQGKSSLFKNTNLNFSLSKNMFCQEKNPTVD